MVCFLYKQFRQTKSSGTSLGGCGKECVELRLFVSYWKVTWKVRSGPRLRSGSQQVLLRCLLALGCWQLCSLLTSMQTC